jgi:GT2 family glycosyltransferase
VTSPTRKRPVVGVVILTHNQAATTLRALESLGASTLADVRVVVWDNASDDDTVAQIRARFPDVVAEWSAENLGVAGGRNTGAALAIARFAPDYLCFLDNDLVLTHGFMDALLEVLQRDPSIGQVQAKLRYLDQPTVLNYGGGVDIRYWIGSTEPIGKHEEDRGQYDREVDCVSCGGAMMVRTPLFTALGGFDTIFNPYGPEDIDFSLRLQRLGHRARYVPKAMAYHAESHTFEPGGYSRNYARHKAKHWLRFLRRHGSPLDKFAFYAIGMPFIAVRMLVREGRRGNLGAVFGAVRGVLTGLFRR